MLVLLAVGKIKNPSFRELAQEYAKRLSHYVKFSLEEIPDGKESDPARQVQSEGEKILKTIKPGDYVVLFDERGRQLKSVEFASWIQTISQKSHKRLVMIIGGAHGFSSGVRERADMTLGLSTLTLPHELARVFALEQLYRAHTILKNEKYHH